MQNFFKLAALSLVALASAATFAQTADPQTKTTTTTTTTTTTVTVSPVPTSTVDPASMISPTDRYLVVTSAGILVHRKLSGKVTVDVPVGACLFLARDWRISLKNESAAKVTISPTLAEGIPTPPITVEPNGFADLTSSSDRTLNIANGAEGKWRVDIIVAKKLQIFSKVGAGLVYNAGDDFGGYKLVDQFVDGTGTGKKIIAKNDQRNFNLNLTGQLYVPFDDEAWLAAPTVAKALTFGQFNSRHHRLGLMAGLATKENSEANYQVGVCWFLDPAGKAAVSYGFSFRAMDELQQGLKSGDVFNGSALPTRKEFKPYFFIGLTFNIGN